MSERALTPQELHDATLTGLFEAQSLTLQKIQATPAPLEHDTLNDLRLEERGEDAEHLTFLNEKIAQMLGSSVK